MKRNQVTADEWIRHRKLRKKIASAKWYALKKEREIEEQRTFRQQLEQQRKEEEARRQGWIWTDPIHRAYWYSVVAHSSWGYPARPPSRDPFLWQTWCGRIEQELRDLRRQTEGCSEQWTRWLYETFVCKIFRQLAIRECMELHDNNRTRFHVYTMPFGCPHPYSQGRLWSTSAWNWLWILTHLGNQREQFPRVWIRVHNVALRNPSVQHTNPFHSLFSMDPVLKHWIDTMADELTDTVHPTTTDTETPDHEDAIHSLSSTTASDVPYHTQESTPPLWAPWDDTSDNNTDSDSESLPSSLDNYLQDTFAIPSSSTWQP